MCKVKGKQKYMLDHIILADMLYQHQWETTCSKMYTHEKAS